MDLNLTAKQAEFREEVKLFIKEEKARGIYEFGDNAFIEVLSQEFSKQMGKKGWIGFSWPKEFGGKGMGYLDRLIMLEELFKVGAPLGYHYIGDRQVGPGLIHFGSEYLRNKFLPSILNVETTWCLLFSEPDAGSDLANCKTNAIDKGDHFLVNGQKVWNSNAHLSDYAWALVKTEHDPKVNKYKSFSELIIDMKSPGITIRPILNTLGIHSFNEVYLDDVKVPKDNLVGTINNGFRQIMTNLVYERCGIDRLLQNASVKQALLEYVKTTYKKNKPLAADSLIRDQIAQLEVEFEVGRLYVYYVSYLLDKGKIPSSEAAVGKTFCTIYESKLADQTMSLMGMPGLQMPDSPEALYEGAVAMSYLWSVPYTLQGGSVEVLKNIIAQRGLNMPVK